MIRWAPYSFLRFTLSLIIGVLIYIHAQHYIDTSLIYTLFGISIGLYLVLFLWHRKTRLYVLRSALGITGLSITTCFGYLLSFQHKEASSPAHIGHQPKIDAYTAVVSNWVQEKGKYYRTELKVTSIHNGTSWIRASGRIQAYIEKQEQEVPKYGDLFLIKGMPQKVKSPANPGEFDYKNYLALQQIYHQHFIKNQQLSLIGYQPVSIVMAKAIQLRMHCRNVLKAYLGDTQEYAIVVALVLGVKDNLDNELRNAYAAAGAMHVLAVSGLHVGIIFLFLNLVLGKLRKHRRGKYLFMLLVLLSLWLYAFVTGLSPSVLRAVTMFSFLVVAQTLRRNTNIYNTLAVSAFALLCYDPYLVMSVGFQLSYVAVLGIVYLYHPINSWLTFDNVLLRKVWQITAVSLAAQLATFPVSLYFFHKFPVFFWLTNLLVIPAAYMILVGGLLLIVISAIPFLASLVGVTLHWFIKLVNTAIFGIEALPGAQLSGLVLHPLQVWLLYGLILLILMFAHYRQFKYLQYAALVCLLMSGVNVWQLYQQAQQQGLVIYNVPGHAAIGFHQGRRMYFLTDAALKHDKPKLEFHVQNDWWQKGVVKATVLDDTSTAYPFYIHRNAGFTLVSWHKSTILFIDQPLTNLPQHVKVIADYIVVQQNAITKPELIFEHFSCKQLILDSSNKSFLAERISSAASSRGYPCYNVQKQGAYVLKL